jgi:Galactose oxidase, central domain
MNVHSVSAELATIARKAKGTVPPKLVVSFTPTLMRVRHTDLLLGRVHDRRRGQNVSVCGLYSSGLSAAQFDTHTLQGGRLVVEHRMLSDLYVFDIQTFTWTKLEPPSHTAVPSPRYFHSSDTCKLL